MTSSLQITLHGVARSAALQEDIRLRAEKLRHFHDVITRCRVVVERPHRHHRQGRQFIVRLRVTVPGADAVANHDHATDVRVALRGAFDAARRQLEDRVGRRDGRGKSHRAARTAAGKRRWGLA